MSVLNPRMQGTYSSILRRGLVMPLNTLRLRIKGSVTLWSSCPNLISQNQAFFRPKSTSLCTFGTEKLHVGKAMHLQGESRKVAVAVQTRHTRIALPQWHAMLLLHSIQDLEWDLQFPRRHVSELLDISNRGHQTRQRINQPPTKENTC